MENLNFTQIQYLTHLLDADNLSLRTVQMMWLFLKKLPEKYGKLLNLKDNITPTPYGTLVADFETEKGLVSVEISKYQIGFFTDFVDMENEMSEGVFFDFAIPTPDELMNNLEKLL
jgi:hypothetical protein